jgi:hypothetical protein
VNARCFEVDLILKPEVHLDGHATTQAHDRHYLDADYEIEGDSRNVLQVEVNKPEIGHLRNYSEANQQQPANRVPIINLLRIVDDPFIIGRGQASFKFEVPRQGHHRPCK